jgi:hypothetical protein
MDYLIHTHRRCLPLRRGVQCFGQFLPGATQAHFERLVVVCRAAAAASCDKLPTVARSNRKSASSCRERPRLAHCFAGALLEAASRSLVTSLPTYRRRQPSPVYSARPMLPDGFLAPGGRYRCDFPSMRRWRCTERTPYRRMRGAWRTRPRTKAWRRAWATSNGLRMAAWRGNSPITSSGEGVVIVNSRRLESRGPSISCTIDVS